MVLSRTLLAASDSDRLRRFAMEAGPARRVARRFVAGETLDEAVAVVRDLNRRGIRVSLDRLGEDVHDVATARDHGAAAVEILDRIERDHLDCSISVKPSALGLLIDAGLCHDLIARLCSRAAEIGTHVMLDMEGSEVTQATVELVVALRGEGHDNVGCALQSYLHRTVDDVRRLTGLGASVRICKGAYEEPADIAYQDREEVSDSFVRAVEIVLRGDTYGRFATHDHRVIARIRNLARRLEVPSERYELQMLYGVREPLQQQVLDAGHDLRVYVPYGREWYPYFMRRLAERPANLMFFLRALAGSRAEPAAPDS